MLSLSSMSEPRLRKNETISLINSGSTATREERRVSSPIQFDLPATTRIVSPLHPSVALIPQGGIHLPMPDDGDGCGRLDTIDEDSMRTSLVPREESRSRRMWSGQPRTDKKRNGANLPTRTHTTLKKRRRCQRRNSKTSTMLLQAMYKARTATTTLGDLSIGLSAFSLSPLPPSVVRISHDEDLNVLYDQGLPATQSNIEKMRLCREKLVNPAPWC